MKKFFTLLAALFVATTMMGQMHGPMKFVGSIQYVCLIDQQ